MVSKQETGRCQLCLKNRDLCRSHVIPESYYKPAYDDDHRAVKLERDNPRVLKEQKGWRDRLLCEQCEGLLNDEYEKSALVFFNEQIPGVVEGKDVTIEGIDYKALRLFVLSVLWRASVANARPWQLYDLGPKHNEQLRQMILTGDVGAADAYQTWAYLIVHPDERTPLHGTIMPLGPLRRGAQWIHRLVFGGCAWHVSVASHPMTDAPPGLLLPGGTFRMAALTMLEYKPLSVPMIEHAKAVLRKEGEERGG